MKTELILVGKTVNKHFIAGIKDYAERITHYMPFNITTIPELKNTKSLSEQQQKEREGELILKLTQIFIAKTTGEQDDNSIRSQLQFRHPDPG